MKAFFKILLVVAILLALIWGWRMYQERANAPEVTNIDVKTKDDDSDDVATTTNPETDAVVPQRVTLRGVTECLPSRDTSGPSTAECSFGIVSEEGEHYGIDTSDTKYSGMTNFEMDVDVRVTGDLVLAESLSSDNWQKYNMRGIIKAESIEKI